MLVAASSGGESAVWRVSNGQLIGRSDQPKPTVRHIAINSNDQTLALFSESSGALEFRRARDGAIAQASLVASEVGMGVFSSDGRKLAAANYTSATYIWDIKAKTQLYISACNRTVTSIVLSSSGDMLACGAHDGTIKLWIVRGSAAREIKTLHGPQARITSLIFSADGKTLVSGDDSGTIIIWTLADV